MLAYLADHTRSVRILCVAVCAPFAAVSGLAFSSLPARAEPGWGGSVTLTSDYVLQGISQSAGRPAVQFDAHDALRGGWYAGLWSSTLDTHHRSADPAAVLSVYGGRGWSFNPDWSATLVAAHYWYLAGDSPHTYNYDELTASLAFRDLLAAAIRWFPDRTAYATTDKDLGGAAWSYEISSHAPLWHAWAASLGVGYYDPRRAHPTGYWFWNAGISDDLGPFHLDLSYLATNQAGKLLFDPGVAGNRWAVTLIWRF